MTILNPIPDVHFSNPRSPEFGIEILTFESLFNRGLEYLLKAPQRVHFYHIFIFTEGEGNHSIDFIDYSYNREILLLVSKGQVQKFQVIPGNKGFIIIFTSEFLYKNATELNLFHSLKVFEHTLFAPNIQLSAKQQQQLKDLTLAMQTEYQRPIDELSSEILQHMLRLMLLHIERIQEVNGPTGRLAPYYQEFVTFRRLVERDLRKSRNVYYYADHLSVSPKRLNELTRQVLNKTAKKFIEEQVILESQRLLAQGSIPIKEIAYELGFSEPTNMVKFFKKHTHTSPAAFRNRFHPSV